MIIWCIILLIVVAIFISNDLNGLPVLALILLLMPMTKTDLKSQILLINIVLSCVSLMSMKFEGLSKITDVFLIFVGSIPAAIFTSKIKLPTELYLIVASVICFFIGAAILINFKNASRKKPDKSWLILGGVLIGALIGFTGIAAAALFFPILNNQLWKDSEEVSFFSLIFVLISSVVVLIFQDVPMLILMENNMTIWIIGTVILGAFIGKKVEFTYFQGSSLRIMSAAFLIVASLYLANKNHQTGINQLKEISLSNIMG
jgi:uncharacterized membrane protein YfcA